MTAPGATVEPAPATEREGDFRFYTYPPTGEELDRVSTIISATNAKPWISGWYGSSSTTWCVDHMTLLSAARKEARKAAIEAGKSETEAAAAGRKAAIDLAESEAERLRTIKRDAGSYVHHVQEALILWAADTKGGSGSDIALPLLPEHLENAWYDDEPLVDVVDWMVTGFMTFVTDFNPVFEAAEMTVYNQPLGVAGTLDAIIAITGYGISYGTGPKGSDRLVAAPGNVLRICVDTKTGRNPEGTWKEQVAVYRRMKECLMPLGDVRPMPATDCGAVLHLRPDYPDGYLLMLVSASENEAAWGRFRDAAGVYRDRQVVKNKPGTSVRPLRADGTMPGPRICDLASEGYGRALSPLGKALGLAAELEDLASFTAVDLLAIKGVGPKLIEVIREMLADHGLYLAGETPETTKAAA